MICNPGDDLQSSLHNLEWICVCCAVKRFAVAFFVGFSIPQRLPPLDLLFHELLSQPNLAEQPWLSSPGAWYLWLPHRGRKSNHYRQIPSLREIVLIAQDQTHVERFVRQPEGGWLLLEEKIPSGKFELSSLAISIAMSELYRNVKFEAADADR